MPKNIVYMWPVCLSLLINPMKLISLSSLSAQNSARNQRKTAPNILCAVRLLKSKDESKSGLAVWSYAYVQHLRYAYE